MANEVKGELNPLGGGDRIPLLRDEMIVGRRESCDIPLRFPNVSSVHCKLMFTDGYWFIQDLNSTNGIKVNGLRVQRKVLLPGDEITIAKRKYVIQYTLAAGRRALEEIMEDDVMSQSLLERAGLTRSRRDDDDDDEDIFRRRRPAQDLPDIDWKSG
jgi:adenylate cyclase